MFKFKRLSIHHQAWLFGVFFCITLLILAFTLIIDLTKNRKDNENYFLNVLLNTYHEAYLVSGVEGLKKSVKDEFFDTFLIVLGENDTRLFSNAESWIIVKKTTLGDNEEKISKKPNGEKNITLRYLVKKMADGNKLIVGVNQTALEKNYYRRSNWLIILIVSAITIAGIASIVLGFFIFRRLQNINKICQLVIDTGDLSLRIPCDSSGKDFDALAGNLNSMLEQIQQLMREVRQVSDNIAHDLRTPLTRLRNKLELLEQGNDCGEQQRKELVCSLKEEADNLLNIFAALLRITNIESGQRHNAFKQLDLKIMLEDLHELYEPLTAEKNQQFVLKVQPCTLLADGDLLFQTLANIIDNAVKYTPEGGVIELSMFCSEHHVEINICDNGIGMHNEEFTKVFQRFYRIEKSRNMPGNGLGLSLVSAVVALHKGQVNLKNNNPGLKLEIRLPINLSK